MVLISYHDCGTFQLLNRDELAIMQLLDNIPWKYCITMDENTDTTQYVDVDWETQLLAEAAVARVESEEIGSPCYPGITLLFCIL